MTNRSRDKGTSWESRVVEYLREHGWPHAERRARRGTRDAGDIAGVVGVCIEAKNEKRITLAEYVDETQVEKANANATVAACWIKRRGKTSPAHGYVVMSGQQFIELLREAGY
jgi:Holliday junction resolvase